MAEPVCPGCGVRGVEHFVSKESRERTRSRKPWFIIVHCDACGHVYNVLARHVFSEANPPRLVMPKPSS
ncbi:MAG: transcriptional regulator [Pseudomonadales bacterium]|nr:transcriptional regulator [Pseudomonadales bacterium]MCP5183789.1 transcriptional regulator [Pseudomonadales bacterium]